MLQGRPTDTLPRVLPFQVPHLCPLEISHMHAHTHTHTHTNMDGPMSRILGNWGLVLPPLLTLFSSKIKWGRWFRPLRVLTASHVGVESGPHQWSGITGSRAGGTPRIWASLFSWWKWSWEHGPYTEPGGAGLFLVVILSHGQPGEDRGTWLGPTASSISTREVYTPSPWVFFSELNIIIPTIHLKDAASSSEMANK